MCAFALLYAMGAARAHVKGYWEMIAEHPASFPAGTPR